MYKKYKELERELLNAKMDLGLATSKVDRLVKASGPPPYVSPQYDQPRVQTSMKILDVNDLYVQIAIAQKRVDIYKEYVEQLEKLKEEIDSAIREYAKKFNDLETEVFVRHHIDRVSLREIATELKYSYAWIKEINGKILKMVKQPTNNLLYKNKIVL